MSFFDSLLYSFSNIFSIGPDLYDDEGDECCGGAGPGGTCCKNIKPSVQQKEVILTTPPLTPPTCQQQQQHSQSHQDLYTCHCSDGDHVTADDSRTTIKLVVCGQQLQRQISSQSVTAPTSSESTSLAWIEDYLQTSTEFKTCAVALGQQCQDVLFSLSHCVFVLSGASKENRPLNRLLDWMNEQIMMTRRHPPLHHLAYGIICLGNQQLATVFQEKLNQLGATEIQPICNVRQLQQQQNDEEVVEDDSIQKWIIAFLNGLRQREQTRSTKHHPTSAGCTNGMVDVEDMGQVAQKISLMNKKKLVQHHPRARPKRIIGLDPTSSKQKAAPTTQVTTHATSSIDI
ncbi:hypothetical protein BCR42DRAFT_412159 [Absidia repens]|uniref:Uncharacterized protein n=1 Tax=Absidia repens TaxID=90262 RepID=A0A1X2IJ97_9FUNG|nr:hypothetical protein BCR42DRAFT_412159 [Absidia repens]